MPVLVVEDHPPSARLLSVLLRGVGCAVRLASSAEDAIAALASFQARILVVDLLLPRMGGLAFVKCFKEQPGRAGVVVIAVSATDSTDAERLALEAGCAAFIRKPIEVLGFVGVLERHVAGAT